MSTRQLQSHGDAAPDAQSHIWPRRRYSQRDRATRLVGGSVIGAAVLFWLTAYWPSPAMRLVSLGLLVVVAWLVAPAAFDVPRPAQRQMQVDAQRLHLRTANGDYSVAWSDVAHGQWRQDRPDVFGLWLYDDQERVLVHLDATLLTDQVEAKAFIEWATQQIGTKLDIRWTQV
jgi:hypothetical protein